MKKFNFIVVDDEGNNDTENDIGYNRILMALEKHNYFKAKPLLETDNNSPQFRKNKQSDSTEIDFTIFTSKYGENRLLKFCTALDLFSKELQNSDFLVFDLNLEKLKFNPCHQDNTCEAAKRYEDKEPQDVVADKVSRFIAGLEFYNLTSKDDRPKIFLSAATQSAELRKNVKFFYKRLEDTFVVDAEHKRYTDINDPQICEAFSAIDSRFQSRQIAIINRQTADKIQELNNIVKAWNGKVERADEPLIPDNGTDSNPENCWSLRTLFPKQVNRIELGTDVEENKKVIYEVLNELNFRKIYKWIVGDHGGIGTSKMDELVTTKNGEQLILNRINTLKSIESEPNLKVSDKASQIYKKVYPNIKFDNLDELAKLCMGTSGDIRKSIGGNFSNGSIEYILCGSSSTQEFSHIGLIKILAQDFGVYIGDIYFLYHCIKGNNKHNFSEGKIPENYSPKLNIDVQCDDESNPQTLVISVIVESDCDYYATIESNNPINKQKTNIDTRLAANPFDIDLKEQAIEDYTCLFSNRYKAKIELQFGKKRLTVTPDRSTTIADETENKTEYVFTIKPI